MSNFSENKKIAISAIAIFIVSFSVMLFFLGRGGGDLGHGQANVLEAGEEKAEDAGELKQSGLLFETDSEGLIINTSKRFNRLMGVEKDKIVGEKIFDHVKKEDLAEFAADFAKIVKEGKNREGVGPYTLVNGETEKLLIFNVKLVNGRDGKIEKITFRAKDLSKKYKSGEAEDSKDDEADKGEKPEEKEWFYKLYPKIKDAENKEQKLLVDKITYRKE